MKTDLFEASKELNSGAKDVLETDLEKTTVSSLAKALLGLSLVAGKLASKKDDLKSTKFTVEFSKEFRLPFVKLAS